MNYATVLCQNVQCDVLKDVIPKVNGDLRGLGKKRPNLTVKHQSTH